MGGKRSEGEGREGQNNYDVTSMVTDNVTWIGGHTASTCVWVVQVPIK
jgi:hypothetical protein